MKILGLLMMSLGAAIALSSLVLLTGPAAGAGLFIGGGIVTSGVAFLKVQEPVFLKKCKI